MVERVTMLRTLYRNVRLDKALKIGNMKIPTSSLRNALQDNYRHLVGLSGNTRVKISTDYNPDQNPRCFLGYVVYTGFCDFDPELVPAWMYIGEGNAR